MITQTIKRWLQRAFAWWPWKSSPAGQPTYMVSQANQGPSPETFLIPPVEGPAPQPGVASIAVDQARDEAAPSASRSFIADEKTGNASSTSTNDRAASSPSATPEQRIAFLRYLVQHGHVNEGFTQEDVPDQYKKSR